MAVFPGRYSGDLISRDTRRLALPKIDATLFSNVENTSSERVHVYTEHSVGLKARRKNCGVFENQGREL